MRVVILNERYKFGGAEVQTVREKENLEQHGHTVLVITFDKNFENGWLSSAHYNYAVVESAQKTRMGFLRPNLGLVRLLKKLLEDFAPDYIHLNNAQEHALSILCAIKGYKCVQTIRDYSAVCPNGMSVQADLSLCKGFENCSTCNNKCFGNESLLKRSWMILKFKINQKYRKQVISQFISPSKMLTDYSNAMGFPTKCVNNPFDFSLLKKYRLKKEYPKNRKVYLFYGLVAEHKGVVQLVNAFSEFMQSKNDVELNIVGRIAPEFEKKFEEMLAGKQNIRYFPAMPYEKILEKLSSVYAVVIPSVWIENYPNTALEAKAVGCLVLGSERGGMCEIINDDRFVFQVLDQESIIRVLELSYRMTEKEYQAVTQNGVQDVEQNNTLEIYYQCLMNIFAQI